MEISCCEDVSTIWRPPYSTQTSWPFIHLAVPVWIFYGPQLEVQIQVNVTFSKWPCHGYRMWASSVNNVAMATECGPVQWAMLLWLQNVGQFSEQRFYGYRMWTSLAQQLGARLESGETLTPVQLGSPFSSKVVFDGHCLVTLLITLI